MKKIHKIILLISFVISMVGIASITFAAESLAILPVVKQYTANGQANLNKLDITIEVANTNSGLQHTADTLAQNLNALGFTATVAAHAASGSNVIKLMQTNAVNLYNHSGKQTAEDLKNNEGYTLIIAPGANLNATITANSGEGVFYGTRSLLQLLAQAKNNNDQLPAGTVVDYPSFKERSLMLDVGRRYFTMATLKKYIRLMSYYKLNMFHLHFSDAPAFRLKDAPNGPYAGIAAKQAYTHQDINTLRDYASQYHIQIVPEIDLPAHASAIAAYYRKLHPGKAIDFDDIIKNVPACSDMDALNPSLEKTLPPIPMFTLNVTNPATVPFIEGIITHFMAWFKKDATHPEQGQFFSIGADEYPNNQSMLKCMNGMHQFAKTHVGYENYDNWYKQCHQPDGSLTAACKGKTSDPLYGELPGGIFVQNFINKIDSDIFQNKEKNDGMKMRIWTGWNASNYANNPGGPWKYSASPINPNQDVHIDSWLVSQNLNNLLNESYGLTNTSYQMTYLVPGASNQIWDYPFPQDYMARAWQPIIYQAKFNGVPIDVNNKNYKNFFGAGLQIWSDGSIPAISDSYYYTLSRRAVMLMANNVWAGNDWRSSALSEAALPALVATMANIGQPPRDASVQTTTPKRCTSLALWQKSNPDLYTLPIPWSISFTVNSNALKDNALHPVVQILDKSRTIAAIKEELNADPSSRKNIPLLPNLTQRYLPFVAVLVKQVQGGAMAGYYDGITGWEASHVVKDCGNGSHCKPPIGTFMLNKAIKSGTQVTLVGNITGVKAIIDRKAYPINDSVMSLPIRNLDNSIANDVTICNYAAADK